jgi:formylglycine-generating enzyme required for sulfatase activity
MKILILASNPRKELNLDREIRDLREVIEKSRNRQEFQVEDALAVRVGDLQDLLLRHRPQIVHFCGHGSGQRGLVFEGNDGGEQWVRTEALSDLFRLFSSHVGCVLLNACYSESQADAIVNHIDYVVGMNQEIRDDAAIAFSKGFYRALGYGCSVKQAFDLGCNSIQLEISGSSKMRSATTEAARKAEVVDAIEHTDIPEHLKPILKERTALVTASDQPLSQETRVAIQLDIDESLETDAKVKQYRDRVREFLSDRKLSPFETIRLEQLRKSLGLSEAEANRILAEEQEPIQRSQDEYEAMLIGLIEAGHYPLDATTQKELQDLRQELGLTDEEVEAIATPILVAAEEDYQVRLAREQQRGSKNNPTHQSANFFTVDLGNGVLLDMVNIPAGTFLMGSPEEQGSGNERPQHSVTVRSFAIGKYAVTQAQWRAVAALPKIKQELNPDPSRFKGDHRPVEQVSWYGAVEFCDRLSQKTGKKYRLPSEAEWEYACRAGTTTEFYFGQTLTHELARCKDHIWMVLMAVTGETASVGSYNPNAFGLYDMHGNVWEWCTDHWYENYQGAPIDGSAWLSEDENVSRVVRGGSWNNDPGYCRSASRVTSKPCRTIDTTGFRVVCLAPRTLA